MKETLSLDFVLGKTRKYGLTLVLLKLIIWHGYICICSPGTTGVNCAASVNECISNPCKNNATCNDLSNGYNCSCLPGYTGKNCSSPTTVEFSGSTKWNLDSSFTNIALSFRTTLRTGLILQIVASDSSLYLALSSLGLSLINNSGVVIHQMEDLVSDAEWHNLSVSLDSHSIAVDIDHRKYNNTVNVGSISSYSLGTVHNASVGIPGYVGCIRGLKIGDKTMEPSSDASLIGGTVGKCDWKRPCFPSPCENGGNCTDLWSAYKCTCPTGYLGNVCSLASCAVRNACSSNTTCFDLKSGNTTCISPLTFNGSFSSVMYSVTDARDFSSLQFSIRTQSPAGLLLASASNSSHFMAIGLNGEKIEVVYRYWYMRTEDRLSGVSKVSNGNWHHVEIKTGVATEIKIDSKTDASKRVSVLNSDFHLLLVNSGIRAGNNSMQNLASFYDSVYFTGCFEKLIVGSDLLQQGTSSGIRSGCNIYGCTNGYTGRNCSMVDSCFNNPCKNGATCRLDSVTGAYTCNCSSGYIGRNCSMVDSCFNNPCKNGATCRIDSVTGAYTCNCSSGYIGRNCSMVDSCLNNPCKNGGSCRSKGSGFVCQCTSGYEGNVCQTSSSSASKVAMWIGIPLAIAVIIIIVLVVLRHCKESSGQSGSYSPSGYEKGQVQMNSMPPMPPKERLI